MWSWRRRSRERDLEREIQAHLDWEADEQIGRGLPPDEARYAAHRAFGNPTSIREICREGWGWTSLETVIQDLRYAWRMPRKNAGATAMAVLALSVGIGVNTAVFTAFNAVALRPIQAAHPQQLVNIHRTEPDDPSAERFSYPDYLYYRDHSQSFSGLIAATGDSLALRAAPAARRVTSLPGRISSLVGFQFPRQLSGSAEFVAGLFVPENYFLVLGISAVRGRTFLPGQEQDFRNHPAILLSYSFWQRRFSADPGLVGSTLNLNGVVCTVIGITPKDFMGTWVNVPDIWLPMASQPLVQQGFDLLRRPEVNCCRLNGRLKPGIALEQAQAEMSVLAEQLRAKHAAGLKNGGPFTILLTRGSPFGWRPQPQVMATVMLIMGAVALVLLIACANVAGLQLARSAARQREIGIRLSLGAGRRRLVRQLLTESAMVAIIAGGLGLLFTWWTLRLLVVTVADSLPTEWGTLALQVDPDLRVFAYVLLISLAAGVLFGLAPALEASKPNLTSALKDEGASIGGGPGRSRLRDLLVGSQVAVCLFLLIAAGLLVRGSSRALRIDPGFETRHILGLDVEVPPGLGYSAAKAATLKRQIIERLSSLPGVRSVTAGHPPLTGGLRTASVSRDGQRLMVNGRGMAFYYRYAAPNYFDTLGIPIVEGRLFTPEEAEAKTPVAIVSEATARRLWPGRDPLGQRFLLDAIERFSGEVYPAALTVQLIGVAKDIRSVSLAQVDTSAVYLPKPPDQIGDSVLVRTEGEPGASMVEVAREIQTIDSNLVVYAQPLGNLLTGNPAFVFSRLAAIFSTGIGLLGLLLASVGIFGMVSYAVVQRTHEVGVRMALGAGKGDVVRLIIRQSLRPVGSGVAVGLAAAAAASRILSALLFGLNSLDTISFVGVPAFLLAVALLASYLPARRAAPVDPMVALRYE